MSLTMLTRKSLSLFGAVGGWRTVVESVVSRALFLVAYLVTGQVPASVLIAVGGVVVLAVVRVCAGGKVWQSAIGLLVVAVSALPAGSTGRAVDFYVAAVVLQACGGVLFLVSMLAGWPVIGVVVSAVRGEGHAWRRDRRELRRYLACSGVFLIKFAIATAVLVPLYLAGAVLPLGIAATLLGGPPAAGVCVYLCGRILRDDP